MDIKKKGICGLCPYNCDVIVTLKDKRIIDVLPDKDGYYGNLCPRGKAAPYIIYSDKRIRTPLIRTGAKGTFAYREGTWEEAIEIVGDNFKKIIAKCGAKGIASYMGGGSLEDSLNDFYPDYFSKIGSPNDMNSGSICFVSSRILAPVLTTGLCGNAFTPDMDNSDVIFIWGTNPKTDSGVSKFGRLLKAKMRGAKIITIDPIKNGTADISDIWVPIKPGTDGALIHGMLKLMIESKKYDKSFVEEYTHGFGDLKAYLDSLSIEYLSRSCGIEVDLIKEITDIFCSTEKVSVTFYTGLEYQPSAVQNTRALYCLWALGGKIDVKGGQYIDRYPADLPEEYKFDPDNIPIGAKEYPLFSALCGRGQFVEFPKAVLEKKPYAVMGLLLLGASPILSYPDKELWERVYKELGFMVIIDRFFTEEAKWADIILPSTTYYENTSYCYNVGNLRLREKVIEPVGEARNDLFILQAIAEKLGFGENLPRNDEEILEMAFKENLNTLRALKENTYGVKKEGLDFIYKKYETGHLRKDGSKGFPTPTGKFEIKSTLLEKYGYNSIPVYSDPYEAIGADKEYDFLLTTGARSLYRYNSFGPNIKELTKKEKEVTLDISKEDSIKLNIEDGEKVKINSPFGTMILPVRITNMAKGVVHIPNGGGNSFQEEGWKVGNPNQVCGYAFRDNISGYISCKAVPCRIIKTNEEAK